ncbi:MAG: DNA repair protein RecN (Recombination protein N) [Gammaproteobacteria bacterium]|nr:MAG: DNA repair protein RecN (Recombination protein N) [Gammaproteobacteria bacterium]TND04765.1 MAG: DNA repair protein RecN (Recombination protein N) [Gammaproteobacteria bacterium]
MLTHIYVRNFAIIEELDLDIDPGMTVLTGETGAGKSILMDAVGLALGDRAGPGVIRHGAERAEIQVSFDPSSLEPVRQWLAEHDFAADDECQLRRTITGDGRSKGYINGTPAPMQLLRELGEQLIDIHGQHEHQSLLRRDMQRRLLDEFAGHATLAAEVSSLFYSWQRSNDELAMLRRAAGDRDARLDLLRYQAQELEVLAPQPDEWQAMEEEHRRLANSNRLRDSCARAVNGLYDDEPSVSSILADSTRDIGQLLEFDNALVPAAELLDSAAIQLHEAVAELRRYLDKLESDPQRLADVEQRIATMFALARKHRIEPGDLVALRERLTEELANLENADIRLDQLVRETAAGRAAFLDAATRLSGGRRKAATKLAKRVTADIHQLGMPGGQFTVVLETVDAEQASAAGLDRIEFHVSANPGQPPMPLNKVVSGGELSRISLAIQVATIQQGGIPTLIFDEVDVGIGGSIAEMVGEKLRTIGRTRQVLCVTHQPQVAALGHNQLRVSKLTGDATTQTRIQALSDEERCDELARMLGGVTITERTRAHAREMMARAQEH